MSLPNYRYVESTDDGCALYECLECYERWEGRTHRVNFCPFCGKAVTLLECLAHDEGEKAEHRYEARRRAWKWTEAGPRWVIQQRYLNRIFPDLPPDEWQDTYAHYPMRKTSARRALNTLRYMRDDAVRLSRGKPDREFRVIVRRNP